VDGFVEHAPRPSAALISFARCEEQLVMPWHVQNHNGVSFIGPISKITSEFFHRPQSQTSQLFSRVADQLITSSSPGRRFKMVSAAWLNF
jgi:hypothetical protein